MSTSSKQRNITVRVRGRDGTFRYDNLDPNTVTIHQLKQLIEQDTGIAPESQHLSITDPRSTAAATATSSSNSSTNSSNSLNDSSLTLNQAKLTHGVMLQLVYDHSKLKSKQDVESEQKREQIKKEVGEMDDLRNLGLKYRSKNWTLETYSQLVEKYKIRIKHQTYAIARTAIVDRLAGQNFQQFLVDFAYQLQRVGYLYGCTVPAEKPVVDSATAAQNQTQNNPKKSEMEFYDENEQYEDVQIKVIYEPKQTSTVTKAVEVGDDDTEEKMIRERADILAGMLGMKPVGWIFSHDGDREVPLLAAEVLRAAELQSKYGKAFVTVSVAPNEEGHIEFEAYQASRQCVELFEKGLLSVHPTNPELIVCKKEVEVERKMTTNIDCLLMTCNVAISSAEYGFLTGFPVRNRPGDENVQSLMAVRDVLLERRKKKMSFVQQVNDFHLLLFLTEFLSLESEFPMLCEAIRNKDNGAMQAFETLIESYAGIQ